jgi:hypothetical protein
MLQSYAVMCLYHVFEVYIRGVLKRLSFLLEKH